MRASKNSKQYGFYEKKEQAIAALAAYNNNPYDVYLRKISFRDLFLQWSEKHFPNITQASVNNYKASFKHFEDIYDKKFAELKTADLQEVLDKCENYSTRLAMKSLLNMMFQYAVKNDITDKEYNKYLEVGKAVKVHKKRPFSDKEIQLMFDKADKAVARIDTVLILIYTGMRINEFLNLETINIHLDERYMIRRK